MDGIMNHYKATLIGSAMCGVLALSGCASEGKQRPSCPVPDGIRCLSTLDVYEQTNSRDYVVGHVDPAATSKDRKSRRNSPSAPVVSGLATPITGEAWGARVDGNTLALDGSPTLNERSVPRTGFASTTTSTEPFRVPAKVMRIYVEAWEDEQGDLHTPGFIFTEIEARRWSVGQPTVEPVGTFRLLEGLGTEAAQDARADAAATASAGRPGRNGANNTSMKGIVP